MKKALAALMACVLTLTLVLSFTVSAGASSGTSGDCTWTLDENYTLTISGNGATANHNMSCSEVWMGQGNYSYSYYVSNHFPHTAKNVIIEEGVTSIGDYAFFGCTEIESITIPSSLISIGYGAFGCFENPNSGWGGGSATPVFIDLAISSVYITDMEAWCNISFEDNPLSGSLYLNNSLITKLGIPRGVTSINDYSFSNCKSITSVVVPDTVTSIGSSAFENCSALTSMDIPDTVTSIGNSAFYGCSSLTSIDIPSGITSIGASTFYDCSAMTSINIPNSVTFIGNSAFYGCSAMTSMSIPNSVTSFGDFAFYNCSRLKSVLIPDRVTSIGSSAFENCFALTSVNIPDSVTSIGSSAFKNCSTLASVDISDGATAIEDSTFYGCSKLNSVNIPDSVISIGNSAFYGCSSLTSLIIGKRATFIDSSAFFQCNKLASITCYSNRSDNPFSNCAALKTIVFGDGVTTIENFRVSSYTSLESVTISHTVTQITSCSFNSAVLNVHKDSAGYTYALQSGNSYVVSEHTPNEPPTVIPSTCTTAGSKSGTCNICGIEYREMLPLLEHTLDEEPVVVPSTCTTKGTETTHCSVCAQDFVTFLPMLEHNNVDGLCTVCGLPDIQSDHPYADNLDQTWTHTVAGAGTISITFSEETYVEENIDYIYLYNSADEELGYYTGAQLAGQTVDVTGNTVKIRLVSDSSTGGYGFRVSALTSIPAVEQTPEGIIRLLKHIDGHDVGLTDTVADINGDGKVTIFDAVKFLQLIPAQ